MYVPENELEAMVVAQVRDVKQQHNEWANPRALACALEIKFADLKLDGAREGAAFAENIVINPTIGVKARQWFTSYHEIIHHLIRRNNKLYSILHDQYSSDEDLERIIERLCNAGAAEFVLPKDSVLAAIEAEGFSIALVKALSRTDEVSSTAACVQLALCAQHKCIAVVCKMDSCLEVSSPTLFNDVALKKRVLLVDMAISSSKTKYRIARGAVIPKGHLFYEAYSAVDRNIVRGKDRIPFRNGLSGEVDCEAICIGTQVFGFFHLDRAPVKSSHQLQLF